MKKLLFTLMTCAAIVSCSKSDVIYDDFQQEIGFTAVASNSTKSVAGYNGNTFDGVFPTNIDLYVFANAQDEENGELLSSWNTPYFKNAKFVYDEEAGVDDTQGSNPAIPTEGAYEGETPRYWPNVKSLKFAGYSDACGVDKTTPTMDFENNILTIPLYTQNNSTYSAEGANDLMWFINTDSYTKQANEVPAQMKHACSWITINVYGDDVTATYTTGEGDDAENHTGWTLNSLKVKSIYHTGNAVCGESTATWNTLSNIKDEFYYNGGTTFTETATEYAAVANNFIVIPQTPTSLDVTYTFVSDATNGLSLTETKNIPLTFDGAAAWQSGYHYIYNIKITATEILIDPVVVDWSAYTGNTIDKDTDE